MQVIYRTLLSILLISIAANASAKYQEYDSLAFISERGDTLLYRQLSPLSIEDGEKYPLVLFLHGAGERGADNISQLRHGSLMFTNPVNRENYPTYVLIPQCPADMFWPTPQKPKNYSEPSSFPLNAEISKPLGLTKELLDEFIASNPVDTDRIYIMGLSMGGMGTFDLVCRYPNLFAAAIPICGGVNTERLTDFSSETSFRIFHGDADPVVPVQLSREAYMELTKAGVSVEYIELPAVNHDSWSPAFNRDDFMPWLFEQRKSK